MTLLCASPLVSAALEPGHTAVYASPGGRDLSLDVYLPNGMPGPYPVVLYIHGGGWSGGTRKNPPVERLVRHGYAVASIDYRLSGEATFPAQIHDCKAAVRWLRANARRHRLRADRIVVWGGSAGGHLAALLGASGGIKELEGSFGNLNQSSRVQGVIDFFGPTDFNRLNGSRKKPRDDGGNSPEERLVGGRLSEKADSVRMANPITYVSKDDPPYLILHGADDDVVPPNQSVLLHEALQASAVSSSYHLIPNRGHGFRTGPEIDYLVDAFLDRVLPARAPKPRPLMVSADMRRLTAGGDPLFLLADTAWALSRRLTMEEAKDYLIQRRAQNFNAVAFSLVNKLPEPAPGSPYWNHVDTLLDEIERLGMYAIVLPAWGNTVVRDKQGAGEVFDEAGARAYARFLGRRYKDRTNVVWMIGGDRSAVAGGRDYRPVFRAMAAGLREGGSRALMSYHPQKRAPQSSHWFHNDDWLAFNSIQHWPEEQAPAIRNDWSLKPTKPTWVFEPRYEGYWKNNYKPEQWGEWQSRFQAYGSVFAGGFGFTFGHERIFGFGGDTVGNEGEREWDWRQFMDTPGARSMYWLGELMNRLPPGALESLTPDLELAMGDAGANSRLESSIIVALTDAAKSLALVYTGGGRPIVLREGRMSAKTLEANWFNPRNGQRVKAVSEDGVRYEPPPPEPGGPDYVLLLRATAHDGNR